MHRQANLKSFANLCSNLEILKEQKVGGYIFINVLGQHI